MVRLTNSSILFQWLEDGLYVIMDESSGNEVALTTDQVRDIRRISYIWIPEGDYS